VSCSRGKKVYRRFDDDDDEEEEIDAEELGLLELNPEKSRVKPLKTLTRRSVKPKRLFQNETQQEALENEAAEEALTDIEEGAEQNGNVEKSDVELSPASPTVKKGRSTRSSKKESPFDSWPRLKSGGDAFPPVSSASKGKKRGAPDVNDEIN
jgi:hypothetical protein